MIANKRNTIMFDSNNCLVIHNYNLVAKGVRDPKKGLYKLEVQSIKTFA